MPSLFRFCIRVSNLGGKRDKVGSRRTGKVKSRGTYKVLLSNGL